MQPYRASNGCPRCGYSKYCVFCPCDCPARAAALVEAGIEPPDEVGPHRHRMCTRCGHTWIETLTAVEGKSC